MTRPQLWGRLLGCGAWCVAAQLWWLALIRLPRRHFEVDSRTGRAYGWLLCRSYGWYDRQWMEWRAERMDETEAMLRRRFGGERYTLEEGDDEDGAALLPIQPCVVGLSNDARAALAEQEGGE